MIIEMGLIISLFILNVLVWAFFARFCSLMWEAIKHIKRADRIKKYQVHFPPTDYPLYLKINGVQYKTTFGSFMQWALKKYFDEHPEKAVKEEIK